MKKYLRLDEILSKTFIYSFIFLKMKILLAKPGELPEISTRPTRLTLALASGRALISNPVYGYVRGLNFNDDMIFLFAVLGVVELGQFVLWILRGLY